MQIIYKVDFCCKIFVNWIFENITHSKFFWNVFRNSKSQKYEWPWLSWNNISKTYHRLSLKTGSNLQLENRTFRTFQIRNEILHHQIEPLYLKQDTPNLKNRMTKQKSLSVTSHVYIYSINLIAINCLSKPTGVSLSSYRDCSPRIILEPNHRSDRPIGFTASLELSSRDK